MPAHAPSSVEPAALARLRGADVLLVEDNELGQEVIRDLLEPMALRLRVAGNGAEALAEIERATPDCVLMDCHMPLMDGFEATRRLRAQARWRDLPIIALTANAMVGDRERCLGAGMNAFLSKPVRSDALFAAMVQWTRPPADPGPTPAGLDTASGLAHAKGKPDRYRKWLTMFRDQDLAHAAPRLEAALAARDLPGVAGLAHSIKGASAIVGADALAGLAEQLKQAADLGDADLVDSLGRQIRAEVVRLSSELALLDDLALPEAAPGDPPASPGV
jgi:CheY-like chemotaxis protein